MSASQTSTPAAQGWMTDKLAGLNLTKSEQNLTCANENSPRSKAALESWQHKMMNHASPQRTTESPPPGARPKNNVMTSSVGPESGGPNALPLPPKNTNSKPSLYSNVPMDHGPRIHPIVKDGQQLSWTHYWLLPEKEAPTAEVKPFSVNPAGPAAEESPLHPPGRRGSDSCVYQNVNVNSTSSMSSSWFPEQSHRHASDAGNNTNWSSLTAASTAA